MKNIKSNLIKLKNVTDNLQKNSKNFFINKKRYWYPLSLPTYGESEIKQALESMIKYRTTMWNKTYKFEKKFSKTVKSKYSIMVNSGSSSDLLMSFSLIDKKLKLLNKNDEIIVPILTWPTHIWSAMMAGLKVKFVDIDKRTLNISVKELKKNITKKTKAIFLVHALGNPCNMDVIQYLAKKHKLIILEDCCEALGSKFGKKFVGNFGLAASYSFFFSHHITTMEGGMITTNDNKLYQNLKYLRSHGWDRNFYKKNQKNFNFVNWGFNVRPTELQAGFGLEQIKKVNQFNLRRRKLYKLFTSKFSKNPNIYFPLIEKKSDPSWFSIPIILSEKSKFKRTQLVSFLEKNGIETRPIIVGNLQHHPVAKVFKEFGKRKFPNADYIHQKGIYIGLSPITDDKTFKKMMNVFEKFLNH